MSSFFIDKTDPQIAEILDRLKRMNKILQKTEFLCLQYISQTMTKAARI